MYYVTLVTPPAETPSSFESRAAWHIIRYYRYTYPLTQPPLSIKFDTKYKPLLYSMVLPVGTDSRLSGHHQQALSTPIYSATCDCNMYSHLGTANVHSMRQITMHHRGTFSVGNRHVHTCGRLWAVRMCTVYMPGARRGRPRSWGGRSEAPPATP